jgi:hypothetical protein
VAAHAIAGRFEVRLGEVGKLGQVNGVAWWIVHDMNYARE